MATEYKTQRANADGGNTHAKAMIQGMEMLLFAMSKENRLEFLELTK